MLTLQVKEKEIENLTPKEEFVRGTVGAVCQINLEEFWQGYENTVVFKRENDCKVYNIPIDSLSNIVEIPYTILAESGSFKVGLFGVKPDEVLPTLWSGDIKIRYGTDTHGTTPPEYEPNELDYLRLNKQDKLIAGENITIKNNVISAKGAITDYTDLSKKPKINGVELVGDKSTSELGLDVDLTDYVKNTDYATMLRAGVVKVSSDNGLSVNENGIISILPANKTQIDNRSIYLAITPQNLEYALKVGLTTNTETLTDEEKTNAQSWLGITELVGDIETALDRIIAIQEELIGGDSI